MLVACQRSRSAAIAAFKLRGSMVCSIQVQRTCSIFKTMQLPKQIMPGGGWRFEDFVWLYCSALAVSIPIIIPTVQFGVIFRLWDKYNKPVNKDICQCSCWDTVFKGEEKFLS